MAQYSLFAPISMLLIVIITFLILAGFIVLCFKKPKAALTIFGIFVGLLIVFAANVFVAATPRIKTVDNETGAYVELPEIDYSAPETLNEPSAIWSDGVEQEYKADVYPSRKAAIKALGRQVVEFAAKLNGGTEPKWFEISRVSLNDIELTEAFKDSLERSKSNPDNAVLTSASGIDDVGTIGLMLRHSEEENGKITKGMYEATVYIDGKESALTAKFVNKNWVDDLASYNNLSKGKEFTVARSFSSCTTAEAASNEALTNAIAVVTNKMHKSFDRVIYNVNAADIYGTNIVNDSFEQTLTGGITDIHRKALLLDTSLSKLNIIHTGKTAAVTKLEIEKKAKLLRKGSSYARILLSVTGLVVVICGVYIFVNAATKGYYTLVLRIVMIAAILIGSAVLVLMMFGGRIVH